MSDQDPFLTREQEKYDNPVPSREFILAHMQSRPKPARFNELCDELSVHDEEREIGLKRRLRAMERDGQIFFNKHKCYCLIDESELEKGKVIGHRDGFGFLELEAGGKDWFIPKHQMKTVLHGDIVLAKPASKGRGGKCDARIVRVIDGQRAPIVGRYFVDHGMALVIPEDPRITQNIMILPGSEKGARHNQMVQVEITQRPSQRMDAVAKVVEVIGDHMAPGMEIEVALRNHDIPYVWPKAVEAQVVPLSDEVEESAKQGRVNLRDLPLITIDGEDARDFDDAVYCEAKKGGGWRLWVAIADASYYVRPDTALDKEAINRGNSVYFPSQVVPMLPEVLSNGLCSLNPQVDRLCMVCEMTISDKGKLSGYKHYEAVMNSHARLTYNKVGAILDGNEELRERYAQEVPHLEELHRMYKVLKQTRDERGAIEFETVETKFIFNADRKIDRIEPVVRNDAHKIIEECMILANIASASLVEKAKEPSLYRIHETPGEERLAGFKDFLSELDLSLDGGLSPSPTDYAKLMQQINEREDRELIQTMLLRSMKQAVYNADNVGHFGLALKRYAHFTSPIRRYPDLLLHRAIKYLIAKEEGRNSERWTPTGGYHYTFDEMDFYGEQCSMTERRADDATREVNDWLKCEYMQDHVGEVMDGVIANVTGFGFFVRLTELHIDGLVHISQLAGKRVAKVSDVVKEGDEVSVKVIGFDRGKVKLSIKEAS